MRKSILKLVGIGTFILTFAMQAQAKFIDTIEKSFQVDPVSAFRLANVNGSVNIVAWQKNVIKITAVITTDKQKDRDRISINMVKYSHGVEVETRYESASSWGTNQSGKVDYTVMVPAKTDLSSIELELVNGSLMIKNVEGEINSESVNGAVVAIGLVGDSEISSVDGNVEIQYKSLTDALNRIALETVNGSVTLYLPGQISAAVDVETVHGSIKNDFGLKVEKDMFIGHTLRGSIGSGKVSISIDSVNGGVEILKI